MDFQDSNYLEKNKAYQSDQRIKQKFLFLCEISTDTSGVITWQNLGPLLKVELLC